MKWYNAHRIVHDTFGLIFGRIHIRFLEERGAAGKGKSRMKELDKKMMIFAWKLPKVDGSI